MRAGMDSLVVDVVEVNVIMGAGMDSLVVDVVEVNVIMGAGMDSLVADVVEVNVIMGAGMHSLVSDFAVNNSPERRAMENDGGWSFFRSTRLIEIKPDP